MSQENPNLKTGCLLLCVLYLTLCLSAYDYNMHEDFLPNCVYPVVTL